MRALLLYFEDSTRAIDSTRRNPTLESKRFVLKSPESTRRNPILSPFVGAARHRDGRGDPAQIRDGRLDPPRARPLHRGGPGRPRASRRRAARVAHGRGPELPRDAAPVPAAARAGPVPARSRLADARRQRGQARPVQGRKRVPNFIGSHLDRFPLVSADFWTSDHSLERPRSVDVFFWNARVWRTHVKLFLSRSGPRSPSRP